MVLMSVRVVHSPWHGATVDGWTTTVVVAVNRFWSNAAGLEAFAQGRDESVEDSTQQVRLGARQQEYPRVPPGDVNIQQTPQYRTHHHPFVAQPRPGGLSPQVLQFRLSNCLAVGRSVGRSARPSVGRLVRPSVAVWLLQSDVLLVTSMLPAGLLLPMSRAIAEPLPKPNSSSRSLTDTFGPEQTVEPPPLLKHLRLFARVCPQASLRSSS